MRESELRLSTNPVALESPLTRPTDTLSPSEGEGRDEGAVQGFKARSFSGNSLPIGWDGFSGNRGISLESNCEISDLTLETEAFRWKSGRRWNLVLGGWCEFWCWRGSAF